MAAKACVYKHHRLPIHFTSSHSILFVACHLSSHWKIHHSNGNYFLSSICYLHCINITTIRNHNLCGFHSSSSVFIRILRLKLHVMTNFYSCNPQHCFSCQILQASCFLASSCLSLGPVSSSCDGAELASKTGGVMSSFG